MEADRIEPGWKQRWPIVGMVHLAPLPGAPRWAGSMAQVLERAAADASALAAGGLDGVLVENFGDAPFHPAAVPVETVAAMALAVAEVARAVPALPIGVNVLRNDAAAALAIAAAAGASFARVNVHTGAMLADQGWLTGQAHRTLRERATLAPNVAIWADVLVKHAVGLPGTGLDAANAAALLPLAHGAIVGSALQHEGRAGTGVEPARVQWLMDAVRAVRERGAR